MRLAKARLPSARKASNGLKTTRDYGACGGHQGTSTCFAHPESYNEKTSHPEAGITQTARAGDGHDPTGAPAKCSSWGRVLSDEN